MRNWVLAANVWLRTAISAFVSWWAWQNLTLQFALTTSAILLAGMLVIGNWVTHRISDGVVHTHASSAAHYADHAIEPLVQELDTGSRLSPEAQAKLDGLLRPATVGPQIVGFRIWKDDTIVYSDRRELIGQTEPASPRRALAWGGKVAAEFGTIEPEHGPAEAVGQPLLEIYAPVRNSATGRIIALAEVYQLAPTLQDELAQAQVGSWVVVAGVTLSMLMLQLLVVREGSRTIVGQRAALDDRISSLSALLRENQILRSRASHANRRVTEMNDAFLRRVGADLHDGPIQLIAMAVLRLDGLQDLLDTADKTIADEAREEITVLREALRETLHEIRNLSSGLAPPDITTLSLTETLKLAARRHERRTGLPVATDLNGLPEDVPLAIKSCLYRFAQEGLSNAYRHAGGKGQGLSARCSTGFLEIEVDDEGTGIKDPDGAFNTGGQGLVGLRDRIESLGGEFSMTRRPHGGTRMKARLEVPLVKGEAEDVI